MSMPIKFKIGTDSHMLKLVKFARMLKPSEPYDPLSPQENYYFHVNINVGESK